MAEVDNAATAAIRANPSARGYWFRACVALLLLFLYSGYCLQALPVVAPAVLAAWAIPANALALPLALISVGTALGSVLGGFLADAKGRKLPIICCTVLQGGAMLLTAFARAPAELYPLMFAIGLGLGGYFSSGIALATELSPDHRKGLMVSLTMLVTPLGLNLCSLLAGYVAPRYGWQPIFAIGGLACIPLVLALALLVPESPKYLARFPQRAEAHGRILARLGLTHDEPAAAVDPGKPARGQVGTLLRERLVDSLFLWLLFFVMYVLGSIVLNWTPVVFSSIGFDVGFASRTLFYWTLGSMAGTLVAGWCMTLVGARTTACVFALGAVAAIAALTFLRIDASMGWLVLLLLPAAGVGVAGVVTTLYTLSAEIYPTAMRATGIGLADAVGRVGGIVSAFIGVILLDRAGAGGVFTTILCLAVLTLAILLYFRQHKAR
ncbi:MAG: MFS transporter [Novosphingobium sp.]|nr:MFS transporter [Novosphingobium sp.]